MSQPGRAESCQQEIQIRSHNEIWEDNTSIDGLRGTCSPRQLDLSSTLVTDEGLSHIILLADLEVLNRSGLRGVSDIGLSKLSALRSLAFVDLRRTPVTAAGASRSKIPRLRTGSSFPMKTFFVRGEDHESWNGSGGL